MDRINGADTIDIGGGRRGFRDENLVAGASGTEVTALFLNMTQEEILKVITEAGLAPSEGDWTQLWQALQILGLAPDRGRRWLAVNSMTLSSAPGAPTVGDAYLVPVGATGIWAGNVGKIAVWFGSGWTYLTPTDGHGVSLPDGRVFERIAGTYVEKLAIDTQSGKWRSAVAGGTADAITASFSPAILLLVDGLSVRVRASAANATTIPTFTPNSGLIAAAPIKKGANLNLAPGDVSAGYWMDLTYDLSSNVWILKNPATGVIPQQLHQVSASVAANALTLGWAGGNLSFRSASAANGSVSSVSANPLSLTVPAGATLGTVSGVISQVLILVLYNGGNPTLGIVHATTTGSLNLDETGVISSSAIGGGANSANVVYSAAPVANSPYRVVGYALITQTTPGQWASPPSMVQPMGSVSILSLVSTAAGFSSAFGPTGYQKLPTGQIFQWGFVTNTGSQSSGSGSFPIAFPNGCRGVFGSRSATNSATYSLSFNWGSSGFGWYDSGSSFPSFGWFAIGN